VLAFRILGPLEVVDRERPVLLGGPKQRALLAILVLRRGEAVSSDRLIDQLWGERPPATAAKTLQGYVSHLRKALGNEVLLTRGGGYLLAAAADQVDAGRFEAMAADARRALAEGDASAARELLDAALGLWRGGPLAELAYEPFAQGEIARLEEARLAALEDRIEADQMLGHDRDVIGELEALVALHPHRERLLGQLMLALYRCGRQTDALAAYRRGRDALNDELGLEPGPELRELEQRILTHDPALEGPATRAPAREPPGRARDAPAARGRVLIAAGGALLLAAAIAAGIVVLTGGGVVTVRVPPNSVAAIDPHTNRVVAQVTVGARPAGIAFGSGSLWVANLDDQTISRINPSTLQTLRAITVAGPPTGIATSAAGVWVVESNISPTASLKSSVFVGRIDPEFDTPSGRVRIGNVIPSGPGVVAAQGNSVWVAPSTGLLTRLDPTTGKVAQQLDPNATPAGVAIGDGAVWLTDTEADNVVRVDSTGLLTSIAVGSGPTGIAFGAGGVWVVDSLDDAVVRIDPGTRSVTATIPVGPSPSGVAFGAGSVWVANSGDGTVTRINPNTNKVQATIPVGGSPQALTIADGRVWVTVDAQSIAPNDRGSGGGTLRIVSSLDVGSMDPALAGPISQELLYATCAQLVNYPDKAGPAGSQLTPEVAQSLPTRSGDDRTYTFQIRPGFRFSPPSNQPVTAQTFKDSIERTLDPRMHSYSAQYLADVVGARAYMAGKASHIAGVVANGDTLTIGLDAPAPDFLSRIAQSAFCAVPSNTPIKGARVIPSAGPYYVASYTPGQGVVLARNPNYHGRRPHHFARIQLAVGIPARRAFAAIEAGSADYTNLALYPSTTTAALAARLVAQYGAGSAAAARGRQQYFVNPGSQLDFFYLNTHRTLFSDVRVRRAVNYAIDRRALARLGDSFLPVPERPTDHYLPPGMPGYRDAHIYPTTPNVAKARQLITQAHAGGRTAVLYTCDIYPCPQQAQIVKTDLAKIDLQVRITSLPSDKMFAREDTPGAPFDLAWDGWIPDYLDPQSMLTSILDDSSNGPTFNDPAYQHKLAMAARLSGPKRYLTYGKLDLDLARNAAPLAAFDNLADNDFFSARIGCQTYGIYGMDLAALCLRHPRR
jgi:YVTN family beta-propeller protein